MEGCSNISEAEVVCYTEDNVLSPTSVGLKTQKAYYEEDILYFENYDMVWLCCKNG